MQAKEVNDNTLNKLVQDQKRALKLVLNIRQFANHLCDAVLKVDEPKVCQLKGRSGSSYWTVYDHFLGRRVYFNSEAEVRQWLDRRYYH
jgi:hypothetical protein